MKAPCWHGKHDIRVETVPDPKVVNPRGAIVRVTSTAIWVGCAARRLDAEHDRSDLDCCESVTSEALRHRGWERVEGDASHPHHFRRTAPGLARTFSRVAQ